jgi:cation diffusion facilitator family transporter
LADRPPAEQGPGVQATAARKERAAVWSILASIAITLAKGAAGFATGSLALISDAAHSLVDVASTTLTWLALRAAHKPADDEHHYGHGKFESVAALAETAFLFLLSGVVAYEGVRRLASQQSAVTFSWAAVAVLVAAILVDAWRWRSLKRIARETGSEALEADALHFSSDLVNSVLVLGALAAAAMGYPQVDAVVAVAVAAFIAVAGFRLAQRTLSTLLDTAPKGLGERVRVLAENVSGVVAVDRVRVRPAGGRILGEVHVRVSRTLPLERVAAIKGAITASIGRELPSAEFTVTADPIQLDDETILERIMLIAAKLHVPIHHVTVQNLSRRLSVSFDLEVDGAMSLGQAHEVATRVENVIREELGPQVEVESHIEPLAVSHLEGREADAATVARIAGTLADNTRADAGIGEVHNVRVRQTAAGLIVNYHCRVAASFNVAAVHALVDDLERRIRLAHPEILRVVGHAEPRFGGEERTDAAAEHRIAPPGLAAIHGR